MWKKDEFVKTSPTLGNVVSRDKSAIESSLDSNDQALAFLIKELSGLRIRLDPIMCCVPKVEGNCDVCKTASLISPMHTKINDIGEKINTCQEILKEINASLEI